MKNRRNRIIAALALALSGSMAMTGFAQEAQTEAAVEAQAAENESEKAAETELAEAQSEKAQADVSDQVATKDEMATPQDVVSEDMEPVYADSIKEGTYSIEVLSSSSMFRIIDCQLTVAGGEMTAVMTMNGDGYLKLFMGTGEEAAAAGEDECIPFELNDDGKQTYEVPVEALDMGVDCAAFSKKKEKWYDRVLVFSAASLPQDARLDTEIVTAQDLGLEDGAYTIEVTLGGGSGKAAVESPAELTVADGAATAVIVFSSPNYDYVLVDGEKYTTVNTEGNSAFEIPVTMFDGEMPITADTIAMSTPHEIEYTLHFDSATAKKAQ